MTLHGSLVRERTRALPPHPRGICEQKKEAGRRFTTRRCAVYADPEAHWALYDLAEKLVDFEDYFRRWRFNHVTTVERIIGLKRGTGGTEGVSYLRRMLEVELFPELRHLRATL